MREAATILVARAARVAPAIVRDAAGSSAPPPDAPTGVPPPPSPGATVGAVGMSIPPLPQAHRPPEASAVSHFPLERDPDSESAPDLGGAMMPRVPGPPRLPAQDARPRATTALLGAAAPSPPPVRSLPKPTLRQAARRKALAALVERVGAALDLASLAEGAPVDEAFARRIEAAAREQAAALGELPDGVDAELLGRDAAREIAGLGPLEALLDDELVTELYVPRAESVLAIRDGQPSLVDLGFTSDAALGRAVARLALTAGAAVAPREAIIERRLPRGARLTAFAPPHAAGGWSVAIRKQAKAEGTLEDHVRAGALSRSMATLLEACVAARANLLVAGAGSVAPMVAALAFASGSGERIAYLSDAEDLLVPHAFVTRLVADDRGSDAAELLRAMARSRPDRLVVGSLGAATAGAALDAVADGAEGLVAGVAAPSLRSGLARLVSQIALARGGAALESVREAVAESFDLGVEVVRGGDGRPRVSRISELAGADAAGVIVRDLFVASADGTGEGGYVATGATPRFLHDFASRGVRLDASLFKRR